MLGNSASSSAATAGAYSISNNNQAKNKQPPSDRKV
jgi:hypothetical protein